MKDKTIFEELGGMPAVDKAVDIFYAKVVSDEHVNAYFAHIDMSKQKHKLAAFLAFAFGAPMPYTGKKLQTAHAHMQISNTQFDAVAGHLVSTLDDLKVNEDLIKKVVDIVQSTRADIVNT